MEEKEPAKVGIQSLWQVRLPPLTPFLRVERFCGDLQLSRNSGSGVAASKLRV